MNERQLIAKSTGTFKSFDGTKIYYEVRGEGAPMVLNYGIGCLINHWRPQVRHFAEAYQVITWDYRAHHHSAIPADRANLNIDALAEDLKCLLDHLQLEKASLWGHSFGAQMLARFYALYPSRAQNLIFVNGFVQNPMHGMFGSQDFTEGLFKFFKAGYQVMPETLGHLWKVGIQSPLAIQLSALAGGFNLKLTSFKDIEIYARGIASMDLNSFLTLFESMMAYDGRSVLEKINVPTLIIAGQADSVTPLKHQEEMHRKIAGSELCVIPYGSHCTQLDLPDLVNLKIDRFLQTNPLKSSAT